MAENTIFEETQRLHQNTVVRYVMPITCGFTLLLVATIMVSQGAPLQDLAIVIGTVVGLPLAIALMPMRTVVTPEEIGVRSLVFYRKRVPIESVTSADAITYNPLFECGGWGIRPTRKHGLVLNIAGDKGVALRYTVDGNEKSLLIGSQRSDELERAIRVAADLSDGLPSESPEHGGAPSVAG